MEEIICPICGLSDASEIEDRKKVNEEVDNPYVCNNCGCEFGKIYGFMYNAIKEVSLSVEKDGLFRKITIEKNMVGAWIKEFEGTSFDKMEQISEDKIRSLKYRRFLNNVLKCYVMSWRNLNEYAKDNEVKKSDIKWVLEMKETGSKIKRFNEYLYGKEEGLLNEKNGEKLQFDTILKVESDVVAPYFDELVKVIEKFTCKKVFSNKKD